MESLGVVKWECRMGFGVEFGSRRIWVWPPCACSYFLF